MFGGTEEIRIGEGLPGLSKLMPQLSAIGGKVMKSRKNEQTDQTGISDA